jgi:short-subunit dehydrogenase
MDLNGKRAVVTGGSSGIGLETARELARRGAAVFIVGRRESLVKQAVDDLKADGAHADGVAADVTSPKGRAKIVATAVEALGGIDVLVNNAGGVRAGKLDDIAEDDILRMIEVNLTAPILLTRAALPQLRAAGDAVIVNVSSGIALVGTPFYASYAAVKAGIAHFGEALRRELKGEGVHVLTVYPGATETPMMATSKVGPATGVTRDTPQAVAQALVQGIEENALQVIRGGEERLAMIARNRAHPEAVDEYFEGAKAKLLEAVRDHRAF